MRNELNRLIGNQNEELAHDFLESEDFSIVARNYHARKLGEIDIIAMRDGVIHFVEVKSGQKDFDPVYNFTPSKQRKMINAAYYYMKQHNLDMEFCLDLIVVRWGEIEFLENITM
ncbi:MAG TPA: YraN family protein [Campylobacterales bacterium]|nr:YraN family protein [Campylobacterales bacterium]